MTGLPVENEVERMMEPGAPFVRFAGVVIRVSSIVMVRRQKEEPRVVSVYLESGVDWNARCATEAGAKSLESQIVDAMVWDERRRAGKVVVRDLDEPEYGDGR